MEAHRLIFLISQPRSGSTMLQLQLQQSNRIKSPPEPWIALPLCGLATGRLELSMLYPQLDGPNAIANFFSSTSFGTTRQFARACLLQAYSALNASDDQLVLDKTPPYHRILPWLELTFPEAKFIVLRRHPLAVIHSCATRWHSGNVRAAIAARYDDLILAPQRLSRLAPLPGRRHILHYEALVKKPCTELAAICKFLGLPMIQEMGHYQPPPGSAKTTPGDNYSTRENTDPKPELADAWLQSPMVNELMQAAVRYFPPDFWSANGYEQPADHPSTALEWPAITTVDLQAKGALEINSYGPPCTAPSSSDQWHFIPHDERDHVATKFLPIATSPEPRLLVDLDLRNHIQSHQLQEPAGLVRIQDQDFHTLFCATWPTEVIGLSAPVIRGVGLRSLRFVFSGKVGVPIPLPTAIGIQSR